jgi:molecular chaperone DnaK (HSP70)
VSYYKYIQKSAIGVQLISKPYCPQARNQHTEEETSDLRLEDLCDVSESVVGRELLGSEALSSRELEQRISEIQKLLAVRGTARYREVQRQVAQSLGITVRSVQRLMQSCQEQGLAGLLKQSRRDRGTVKISREWQDFIVKTYREGNCRVPRYLSSVPRSLSHDSKAINCIQNTNDRVMLSHN